MYYSFVIILLSQIKVVKRCISADRVRISIYNNQFKGFYMKLISSYTFF